MDLHFPLPMQFSQITEIIGNMTWKTVSENTYSG